MGQPVCTENCLLRAISWFINHSMRNPFNEKIRLLSHKSVGPTLNKSIKTDKDVSNSTFTQSFFHSEKARVRLIQKKNTEKDGQDRENINTKHVLLLHQRITKKLTFSARITPNVTENMQASKKILQKQLSPNLIGNISNQLRDIASLPLKMSGVNIQLLCDY